MSTKLKCPSVEWFCNGWNPARDVVRLCHPLLPQCREVSNYSPVSLRMLMLAYAEVEALMI